MASGGYFERTRSRHFALHLARYVLEDVFYSVCDHFRRGSIRTTPFRAVNFENRHRLHGWSEESSELSSEVDDYPQSAVCIDKEDYESLPSRGRRRTLAERALYRRFSRGQPPEKEDTDWIEDDKEISDVSSEVIDLENYVREEREEKAEEKKRKDEEFDPVRGKKLIVQFLETHWKITDRVSYTAEFMCLVSLPSRERFKYCTMWTNGFTSSYVYFNVDLNEDAKGKKSLSLTYTFPFSDAIHRERRILQEEHYEWLAGFESYKDALLPYLQPHHRILHVGCGSSDLSMRLHQLGFVHITNVDYSQVLIDSRKEKHPEMDWICDDMRSLSLVDSSSFDVVIEKATIEALLVNEKSPWSPSDSVLSMLDSVWMAITRVLRPGGLFLSVSFTQPHFRVPALARNSEWGVEVSHFGDHFHFFVYACRKGTKVDEETRQKYCGIATDWLRPLTGAE